MYLILRGETLTGEQAQDIVVRTFDGEDLWLSIAGAPLFDDEGHIAGAVVVTRDLTAQQRAAERMHSALLQFAEALVQAGAVEGPNARGKKTKE
jgi:PAS domain-containing protein